MTISPRRMRHLALVPAIATLGLFSASPALAQDSNPNNLKCGGFIKKGAVDPADKTVGTVNYEVGCSGNITGYSLISTRAINSYETEIFPLDFVSKQVAAADSFSCQGDMPGFGLNCVGSTSWAWRVIQGKFEIDGDVCAEPRVDVLMFATVATTDSKGKLNQAISGPFDIGRPRGCPKSARGGKTLIPKDAMPDSVMGNVVPGPAATSTKTTTVKKKVVKKTSKKSAKKTVKK